MFGFLFNPFKQAISSSLSFGQKQFKKLIAPKACAPLASALLDLPKSKTQLLAENALLRQQLLVLNRQVKHPKFQPRDRIWLVFLASLVKSWRQLLLIVKPDTLLKWHRAGFKLFWKQKSKPKNHQPKISQETIDLIQKLAKENPLWGAERIRGELKKLNIMVAKRTIQRYMRQAKPTNPPSQSWRTFLKNHASEIWACD